MFTYRNIRKCRARAERILLGALLAFSLLVTAAPPFAEGDEAPSGQDRAGSAIEHSSAIRVGVNLVLVPVTVTDRNSKAVTDLDKQHFTVFEDGVEQSLLSFSNDDSPCSIGLVLDLSGSMRNKISPMRAAIRTFVDSTDIQDEFSLTTFSDHPDLQTEFTSDVPSIANQLLVARVGGSTALIDAVYVALQRMKFARHPRRALLVISDGQDNYSRYSEKDLLRSIVEADVQIHTLTISDTPQTKQEFFADRNGLALMEKLADASGGLHLVVRNTGQLDEVISKLARTLHSQYILGYQPGRRVADGKWRKIRVRLVGGKRTDSLRVYARSGYYAPHE